ncbi:unnamed protein product [Rhizophagus irregularis]|nr:unnamed protein product [Rhizophagus irregularis]
MKNGVPGKEKLLTQISKGTVCDTTLPEGLKEGQSFEKALYTPSTKAEIDTEFEFGRDDTGILYIVDEVLTPDSSRFWLSLNYEVGKSQESFDKQYLRNYLLSIDFDKKTSIELPNDIVTKTMERYIEAYKMITDSDPTFL